MRKLLHTIAILFALAATSNAYYVEGGKVHTDSGQRIDLYGVSWFGFETHNNVAHGLWARNWQDMIQQIKDSGFTAVRLPFCPATLDGTGVSSINYFLNPDLEGLDSLEIMDLVIGELGRQGLYILLDHHTADCQTINELWYTGEYSEREWIDDLVFVAERYSGVPGFVGIDIKNEPHGQATWGTGNVSTDWNRAAETAAAEVLAANPDILIFVQGVQDNPVCSGPISHWWGGNLEPFACYPLDVPADKLVLSPHVYGPDVFVQPYFNDPSFPQNMPAVWDTHFGYLADQGYSVIIGEFGGRYGDNDPRDRDWQDALIRYMDDNDMTDFFYWSWNPNSGDTGGILRDDWTTVNQDKLALLSILMDGTAPPPPGDAQCSDGEDNDGDGFTDYPDDPGCHSGNDDNEFNEPVAEDLTTSVNIRDDWGTGYCADVVVTNNGALASDWIVVVTVEGTVRDLWNAVYSQQDDKVTAEGVSWNNVVNAGQSVTFGFCADRRSSPQPTPVPTPVPTPTPTPTPTPPPSFACSDGADNDGDGLADYPLDPGCMSVTDNDEFNAPQGGVSATVNINDDWGSGYCAQVSVLNNGSQPVDWTASFPIEGTVRNMWSAQYSQSGNTVTAEGVPWNNIVQPGSAVVFGFCALR